MLENAYFDSKIGVLGTFDPQSGMQHCRRRSRASPVLTAFGLVYGNPVYLTPHRIDVPKPIAKKFVTGDYVHDFYSCAKFGENPSMGDFWANR